MHTRPQPDSDEFEVVRDPLWNTIRLDRTALRIIDSPSFQRLRGIRQLGLAHLVYPGATHTRFDHALGVYHLARRTLGILAERGELEQVDREECRLVPYAALLHDVGHYPFSHAVEELGADRVPEDHEELAGRFLREPDLAAALASIGPDAAERIERLIRGASASPLQGLVAGSLDLDKIEYLNRDAMFCGVPYGVVDVDRLLHALTLLRDPATGRLEVGVHHKGLSALESLLFAKYQMFRNVYWHHAVRAATVLYLRLVREAVDAGAIEAGDLVGRTDEGLLTRIEAGATATGASGEAILRKWLPAVRNRRLPKRALELPGNSVQDLPFQRWWYEDDGLRRRLEERLARELGLSPGELFLDYPSKPRMMGLDLLLLEEGAEPQRLTEGGRAGRIDLPRVADELYHSARVFRVFTVERRELPAAPLLELLRMGRESLEHRLTQTEPLI
jgi:HD superfamily phosphohydrolase